MLLQQLFESLDRLDERGMPDVEQYGQWRVEMSPKPVNMGNLTNNTAMYVAKVTRGAGAKQQTYMGVGKSQAEARDSALQKAHGTERSEDPSAFRSFTADLNADFTRAYIDDRVPSYFKFDRKGEHIVMTLASPRFVRAFGDEIRELGFRRAANRVATRQQEGGNSTDIYGFPVSINTVKNMGMIPNMRYTLEPAGPDTDGNYQFVLHKLTRVQSSSDRQRMNTPGVTIAGTLLQTNEEDQSKGRSAADYDQELANAKRFAQMHYPKLDPEQAFDKWVQRSLKHSEVDDRLQDKKIDNLVQQVSDLHALVSSLKKEHAGMKKSKPQPTKSKQSQQLAKVEEKQEVWDKPNPVKKHKTLSPGKKAAAKRRASAAGRPYPNMVDNIWAAKN